MAKEHARMQPAKATRFVFEYDGDELRLVAQQNVEMVIPPANASATDGPGYYLEPRDAGGRTLARVKAQGAFTRSAEVFPENHREPITRVDVPRQRGAFTVTVPALDDADHVTLVRIAAPRAGAGANLEAAAVVDLATFPLNRR
jgi:hypothetical protein